MPEPILIIDDSQTVIVEKALQRESKPAFAAVPIIMLSRRDGVIDQMLARLSGACDYVTKPFTTQTITTLVHHYIGTSVC